MATAKQFLDAIELQKLVTNDVLDKLYDQYRASGGAITAESLADQLVKAGALSQDKATVLLQSPSDSFIQLGSGVLDSVSGSRSGSGRTGSGSGTGSAVGDPFDDELEAKKSHHGEERDETGRRKHVKKAHKNDFDSPLLLIGGGVLALLVLGGAGLAFMMNLQSGDQLIESAQAAYASGSYSVARDDYAQFVEDFTGNARWSEARVALAVVKLRQAIESNADWTKSLAIAQEEIPQIEDEPAFAESRGEFASLLPRIARGLAEDADAASAQDGTGDRVTQLVAAAGEALTLVGNTKYVPKSLRDDADLAVIRELLDRVARRREAVADLEQTLAKIDASLGGGDVSGAYAEQTALLRRRPELRDNPRLAEKLAAAVEAERQVVQFVSDEASAESAARPAPLALALANPRRAGTAKAEGVFTSTFGGTLYAVSASEGKLLWRQPVGTRLADVPAVVIDDDRLVIDHRHGDLLRLESTTGALVWRAPLEEPAGAGTLYQPVVAGRRVLVASETGRLWAVDAASGKRVGYAGFAQPLRAPPAVDESRGKVYVHGEQSSLYTLDIETLDCVAVRFTGHGAGSVPVAPLAIGGRVIALQNTGAETSQLNLYATDIDGLVSNQLRDWRLEGTVSSRPTVAGRRLLVTTDSGAVYLFEVTSTQDGQPLILVASRAALSSTRRGGRAVEARGDVWIAGEGLRRTAASLADSQLVSRDLPDPCDGDLFFGPFTLRGDTILHARRRVNQPGATLAASDARSGRLIWETDLAIPPLGAPSVSAKPRGLVTTNVLGQTHLLGGREISTRVSPKPVTKPPRQREYDSVVRLGGGVSVATTVGAAEWLAMSPGAKAGSTNLPGELACLPARAGAAIVAPLRVGQVHLLDAVGKQAGLPFQPSIAAGKSIGWTTPAVGLVAGEQLAVLTDGAENAYCLAVVGGDKPALLKRGTHRLTGARPMTAAAIAGNRAAVGLEGGLVAVYDLPTMEAPRFVKLSAELVWGPHAAGEVFLAATAERLIAINASDASTLWDIAHDNGAPVGAPSAKDGSVLVASGEGYLTRRSLSDGVASETIDLGQPVASGATAYGKRLLVSAADGSVLVITKP